MNRVEGAGKELPPVVREALGSLRAVPELGGREWEKHRQAFLAEVRSLAVEGAVTSEEKPRRKGWSTALGSFFTFRLKEAPPMSIIARLVIMIALALGGSFGTAQAARDSLPGSVLYAVKVQLEQLEARLARTPAEATNRALAQAEVRVEEAARLVDRGQPVPEEVVERYAQHLQMALQASDRMEEPMRRQVQQQIAQSLQQQMQVMAQMTSRVREQNGDGEDQGVEEMMQVIRQAQMQLCPSAGETCPGLNPGHEAGPQAPAGNGQHNHDGDGSDKPQGMTPTPMSAEQEGGCMEEGQCGATPTLTLTPTPKCTPTEQPKSHGDEGSMDDHHDVAPTPTPVPTSEGAPADQGEHDQQDEGDMDHQQSPTPTPESTPSDQDGGDMGGDHDGGSHNPGDGGH